MAKGINKVTLIGNLGSDPENKHLPSGSSVSEFSLATTRAWKDKQTGQQTEETEWHRITAFGRLAEICGEYLRKGSQIYCEGRLKTDKWQDQQGNNRYTTKVVIDEMQMLGGRGDGQQSNQQQPAQQNQQQGGWNPQPTQQPAQQQSAGNGGWGGQQQPQVGTGGMIDDDIPFNLHERGMVV